MKVLHITTNYPTPEFPIFGIFVKEQIESLQKLGIDCDVFYCDGKNRGFRQYVSYLPRLWWSVISGGYDVIHCHHALSAIILSLTGLTLFKKVVLSYQNDPTKEWGDIFFRFFNTHFKAFIIKNNSGHYLRYPKVHYIPNGCNQDFFHPMDKQSCRSELGWDYNKKYIIFMDSNRGVRTQKRRDRFDAAVNILKNNYGYDVEIVVMRNVHREFIPVYINAADLHMISSDYEGSPNSVKECLCCNTPVVSTDVGNVREMVSGIEGAFVVDEFSAEALADACDKVFKSDVPFNGRDKFLAKGYSMDAIALKLKELYETI